MESEVSRETCRTSWRSIQLRTLSASTICRVCRVPARPVGLTSLQAYAPCLRASNAAECEACAQATMHPSHLHGWRSHELNARTVGIGCSCLGMNCCQPCTPSSPQGPPARSPGRCQPGRECVQNELVPEHVHGPCCAALLQPAMPHEPPRIRNDLEPEVSRET